MNPKTAKVIITLLGVVSIPTALYPFIEAYNVFSQVQGAADYVTFDTGVFFLTLMSVFWPINLFQWIGQKKSMSAKKPSTSTFHYAKLKALEFAGVILVAWFIATIVIANVGGNIVKSRLLENGYVACDDLSEISRISRGESFIFVKNVDCPR